MNESMTMTKCPRCEEAYSRKAAEIVAQREAQWGKDQTEYCRLSRMLDEMNAARNQRTLAIATCSTVTPRDGGIDVTFDVEWKCAFCGLAGRKFYNYFPTLDVEKRTPSEWEPKALPEALTAAGGARA